MGREKLKNTMRTAEAKEKIVLEYLNNKEGLHYYERKYNINYGTLHKWYDKYQKDGLDGLKSKTGKKSGGTKGKGNKKLNNREEELEKIIMKQEIEIARLKKGYMVKGVGVKKEYVTTFEKSMK
jgi:transposase-like protein